MHASLRLVLGTRTTRGAALVALVGLSFLTTSASAELGRLSFADATGPVCTGLTPCSPSSGSACVGMPGSNCLMLPGHDVSICTTLASPELEAFCCGGDGDCLGSETGIVSCAIVLGTPDGASGVCIDTRKDWCVADPGAEIDLLTLRQCLTPPTGVAGATPSWDTGDCDLDGVANAMDGCPCRPGPTDGTTPGCPGLIMDGGVRDAGRIDSGIDPTLDAGSSDAGPPDAGLPSEDAGSDIDSGNVSTPDASAPSEDAGSTPGDDAGPTGSFTGAGGCATSGGRSGGSTFVWGLAVLGFALRRRR